MNATTTLPATFRLSGIEGPASCGFGYATATFTVRGESVEIATAMDFGCRAPFSKKTLSREAARREWAKLLATGWKVAK